MHLASGSPARFQIQKKADPPFDPSGRLFFESDNPIDQNKDFNLKQEEQDLKYGLKSINQVCAERRPSTRAVGRMPSCMAWVTK